MEIPPRPVPHPAGPPASGRRDFVSVDDSGAFMYHASEPELLAAFEYVGQASCVVDRAGTSYDLALGPDGGLILGHELGPVEFHALRRALLDARKVHTEDHRLLRFYPATPDRLLSDLFETLALEHGTGPARGSWTLNIDGRAVSQPTFRDVDRHVSGLDELQNVSIEDPFHHVYRPVRHREHWYVPAKTGAVRYVEVAGVS